MEKVTYVWEINLSLTMMYADSVSFLTSIDDRIQKYSLIFGFSWNKFIGEFSMVCKESVI